MQHHAVWTRLRGGKPSGSIRSASLRKLPAQFVDPDFLHPYTDEFTIGVEKELGADLAVSGVFSYRKGNRLTDSVDVGVPFSDFSPVEAPDPGPDNVIGTPDDGDVFTVFNQDEDTLGQNQRMLTNPEGNDSTFKGFEVTLQKRMSNNWATIISYSYNDTDMITRGGEFDGDANGFHENPNNLINARGKSFYDRTNQFKLAGTYLAPRGFRISGVFRAQTGQPIARTFQVSGLNQGTNTILSGPIGSERLPGVVTADITIAKAFDLGRGNMALVPEVAIFNIANANTVTSVITSSGSAFGQVLNFLSPRIFRFGMRFNF